MWRLDLIFIQFVILFILNTKAARILAVLPTPSISHQIVFRPLMVELAKRGHEVVVITTDPMRVKTEWAANLTEIDIHDVSYKTWGEIFMRTNKGTNAGMYEQMQVLMEILPVLFDKILQSGKVQELLQDKTQEFDLIFIEAWFRPALSFIHFYKNAPVILISSFAAVMDNDDVVGAPTHPILYPSITRQRIHNLTMWEKISELYHFYKLKVYFAFQEEEENKMLQQRFGEDFPAISELKKRVDMLFLNINPIWLGNYPVPPNVVFLGGLHRAPGKPLPEDLKSFLDSSVNGVIYISFGTNVIPSLLPPEKIRILVSVLSQLPYDVLWKWDSDELPGRTKNIRISKWFPQPDLLRHPKIKLFVTQGGLQSTDEALTAGVPLIGIPMLGDQWFNTEKYVHHQIGMKLEMDTITEESFTAAIKTVIEDRSYRQNVMKLRELMLDQPQNSLERAVWWTEYILRHGGRHLRSPAANISWAEYFEIELVLFALVIMIALFTLVLTTLDFVIRYINTKEKEKFKKL